MHVLLLASVALLPDVAFAHIGRPAHLASRTSYNTACVAIAGAISTASSVYYPGSANYASDNAHYASSSSQNSACSVEPGAVADVATILQTVGASRTPFAIKGGGHTFNPGFSSTPGVEIAMTRFNQIVYDAPSQTVQVGAGVIWDDIYTALAPFSVNVVGGRVQGLGVAGFVLGGGYSWLTSQYGLALDSAVAFGLVLPNGNVVEVSSTSHPDLFFALKGGLNNFGIVTKFTLKTYPQTDVWGGITTIGPDGVNAVVTAVSNYFATVTDPKAAILVEFFTVVGYPSPLANVQLFYDAPTPPPGLFDAFLAITPLAPADISSRSFISFFESTPQSSNTRWLQDAIPVLAYTQPLVQAFLNETLILTAKLANTSAALMGHVIEPFLPTYLSHGPPASSGYPSSAWPPSRSLALLPSTVVVNWDSAADDSAVRAAIQQSAADLTARAVALGQPVRPYDWNVAKYTNYAGYWTPINQIYGSNLGLLEQLKGLYDPGRIMALSGGFQL